MNSESSRDTQIRRVKVEILVSYPVLSFHSQNDYVIPIGREKRTIFGQQLDT